LPIRLSFTTPGFLIGEFQISAPELVVRDIPVDVVLVEVMIIRLIGKAGIRRYGYTGLKDIRAEIKPLVAILNRFQYRLQRMVSSDIGK